eukprot:6160895-Lingulodinium_polyedra.AAC.1
MLRNPRRHLAHGPLVEVVGPPAVHVVPRCPRALRQEVLDAAVNLVQHELVPVAGAAVDELVDRVL